MLADIKTLEHLLLPESTAPVLVAVQGRVGSSKPIQCELSSDKAAIREVIVFGHSMQPGFQQCFLAIQSFAVSCIRHAYIHHVMVHAHGAGERAA
jgi:hypothetical protein